MLQIKFMGIFCEITLRWMPQNTFDDKSTLVQVMTWCRQATSHYLGQCWSSSISPYIVTIGHNVSNTGLHQIKNHCYGSSVNTLRLRQNGRHFPDDIFKCIFLNENSSISIKISLKFVPKGPINNIPALIQIMAWRRSGDKPLSEPMMVSLPTHICVARPQWVKFGAGCLPEPLLVGHQADDEKQFKNIEISL